MPFFPVPAEARGLAGRVRLCSRRPVPGVTPRPGRCGVRGLDFGAEREGAGLSRKKLIIFLRRPAIIALARPAYWPSARGMLATQCRSILFLQRQFFSLRHE